MTTVACPFGPCGAGAVELVDELLAPGRPETGQRLVEHRYVHAGATADGQLCPASLMAWPLGADELAALAECEAWMTTPLDGPRQPDADLWFGAGVPEHSLLPHPTDSRWFRHHL